MALFNPMGRPTVTPIRSTGVWKALPQGRARIAPLQVPNTASRAPRPASVGNWQALDAYQQIVRGIGGEAAPSNVGIFPLLGRFGMAGAVSTLFALLFGAGCADEVPSKGDTTPRARPVPTRPLAHSADSAIESVALRFPDGLEMKFSMTTGGIFKVSAKTPCIMAWGDLIRRTRLGVEKSLRKYYDTEPRISTRELACPKSGEFGKIRLITTAMWDLSGVAKKKRDRLMEAAKRLRRMLAGALLPPAVGSKPTQERPRPTEPRSEPRSAEPRRPADEGGDDEVVF